MASLARYHATIRVIESARLTSTEHSIWRAFLDEAVNPEYATCYIWEKIHDHPACSPDRTHASAVASVSLLTLEPVTKQEKVPSKAGALVEARDNLHCFMLDRKPSGPNVSVRFDHAWVIECAGFYPEYWEFTGLFYGAQPLPEIQYVIHKAFTGDTYEERLETERLSWYDTPFGI